MNLKREIYKAVAALHQCDYDLIYISGKVTGLDPMDVYLKFLAAEQGLVAHNYAIFNPTAWLTPDTDWQYAMKLCLAVLPMCDGILLLPDWHQSKGARIERDQALLLGIPTIEL